MPVHHALSSQQQQQACSSANTMASRSKPILIQNHHLVLEEEEAEREAQEKQFYEGATWRMYNRIVDHRLNTPPQPTAPIYDTCNGWESPQVVSPVGSPTTQLVRPKARYALAGTPFVPSFGQFNSTEPVFDMEGLEDEVFDFEL